jgi:hypothetical protein
MPYTLDPLTGYQVWDGVTSQTVHTPSTLSTLESHAAQLNALVGEFVLTFAELQAAIALAGNTIVTLGADISITAAIEVPSGMTLRFGQYKFVQTGTYAVLIYGTVQDGRHQIFEDFLEGEIRGTFGHGMVLPEWWGLTGTDSTDGQHDIAINCAIKAGVYGNHQTTALLDARTYYVQRPLDLRGTRNRLKGAGQSSTYIRSTPQFEPDEWEWSSIHQDCLPTGIASVTSIADGGGGTSVLTTAAGGTTELYVDQSITLSSATVGGYNGTWVISAITDHQTVTIVKAWLGNATATLTPVTLDNQMETGADSASSVIYIGGTTDDSDGTTFMTAVEGVYVDATDATIANPLKRISAISWTNWVEEGSYVRDVIIHGYSGFGIGGESVTGTSVINYLEITHFHMGAGLRRGALPIFIPLHAINVRINTGTINCTVPQTHTRAAVEPMDYIYEWCQFGLLLAGAHTVVEGVHVEGVGNAFHIYTGDIGGISVTLTGCDHSSLMDRGMVYTEDTDNRRDYVPDFTTDQYTNDNLGSRAGYLFHYKCGVSIGGLPGIAGVTAIGYRQTVTLNGYGSAGRGGYLLRDWCFNQNVTGYGWGQFPNSPNKRIGFYSRGTPYQDHLEFKIISAATHSAGARTNLLVDDSTGILGGEYVYIKTQTGGLGGEASDYDEGDVSEAWLVNSIPDGTHVVIDKAWTATVAGTGWRLAASFHYGEPLQAPLVDRTYYIPPIY